MSISTVSLYLTEACNLRCRYCFVHKQPRRLSVELGRRVLDFMLAAPPAVKRVSVFFFGGEPLLEFGTMRELTAYGRAEAKARGKELRLGLTTNGTLMTDEVLDFLFANQFSINLSLDGKPETHDANRRTLDGQGSFHLVDRAISRILKHNPYQGARMTYDPESVGSLYEDHEYLWGRGFTNTSPIPVLEQAWPAEALAEAEHQQRLMAAAILARLRRGDVRRVGFLSKYVRRLEANAPQRLRQPCGICNGYIGIATDGVLYPCQRFAASGAYPFGTVGEITHPENRRAMLSFTSAHLQGCDGCPARMACAGGCPAVNHVCTGDITRPWPTQCAFIRMEYAVSTWFYEAVKAEDRKLLDQFLGTPRRGAGGTGRASRLPCDAEPETAGTPAVGT